MAQKHGGVFRTHWKFANEFYCEKTGVVVIVNKSSHRIAQYSAKLGRYKIGDEEARGPLVAFIGARVIKEDILSGELDSASLDAAVEQLIQAKAWIAEQIAFNCREARAELARKEAESNEVPAERRRNGSIETETEVPSNRDDENVAAEVA